MSSASSSSRRPLDQGVSASRAGTAQKRPPSGAHRGLSKTARVSVARSSSSRHSDSGESSSVRRKPSASTPRAAPATVRTPSQTTTRPQARTAVVEREARWATADRVLLDRTLRLQSISPLHFSSLPSSVQAVAPPLFQMLRAELLQYINLRLSDGLGFLEASETAATSVPESGDLRPPAKRRRAGMDKVGKVRIDFLDNQDFSETYSDADKAKTWVIEIELGMPIPDTSTEALRAPEDAPLAELCHIVFLPAPQGEGEARGRLSRSYPLIATKTPSVVSASADPLLPSLTANLGPLVLGHALDWIQKRFDCRISSALGATSIASQLKGPRLESLAELIVRQTRTEFGTKTGAHRTSVQRTVDEQVKPVELAFAFPATVQGPLGTRVPGPAPEISALTLTVPWEICMTLLETLPIDQPLLPALNTYLSSHTSIPLDTLELVKIGVAGISVGSGRVKISHVPRERDADGKQRVAPSDRRRAGAVLSYLARLANGIADAKA